MIRGGAANVLRRFDRLAEVSAALAAALLLSSCASTPRSAPELSGRLAVHVPAQTNVAARSLATQFELRGDATTGSLQLTTPIGITSAEAHWQPGRAELVTPDGRRSFDSLDALAEQMLGEPLPLAALIEWLRGRPWAGAPSRLEDGGFEQLGWRIDLSRFGQGWVLAARERAPAVSVRARLETPP